MIMQASLALLVAVASLACPALAGTLVVNANTSAVTILLPSISEDVGAPIAQLQWAVTGYSLVGAAVIVTSGALGDVFGRRKLFLAGLALFIGSCALIALSTSGTGVIAGRMIQGEAAILKVYCPDKLPEFQDKLGDLEFDDTLEN